MSKRGRGRKKRVTERKRESEREIEREREIKYVCGMCGRDSM